MGPANAAAPRLDREDTRKRAGGPRAERHALPRHVAQHQGEDARILEQIELCEFRNELAGEIDILVVPKSHPEQSTAIQVKRFKAEVKTDGQGFDDAQVGHPLRFQELMAKGIAQANET